ncbi:MAG: HAD family hydrolase [Thermovirgaceae bacterium]|nr:HAD family hydrolase [Thermovirgaceae bacterium]
MTRAVLFDFDMTLIDSSHGVTFCLNRVADLFGLPPVEREGVLKTIGYPMEEAMEMLWGFFDPPWIEHYRQNLVPLEHERLIPLPGVVKTLRKLQEKGIAMAVVSNRRRLLPAVSSAGLEGFFSYLVGMEDVDMPKPHPEPIHLALKMLGEAPERAVFVGDSEVDARAAKNAGVRFIGLTTGGRSPSDLFSEGAHAVVDDLSDILPLILTESHKDAPSADNGVL